MYIRRLRRVGKSLMIALPPALLKNAGLAAGSAVSVAAKGDCLVVKPAKRPHYSLAQLLAMGTTEGPISAEDHAWLDAPPVGRELI